MWVYSANEYAQKHPTEYKDFVENASTPVERAGRGGCEGICDTCKARECTATKGHPLDHRCDVCD